MNIILNIKSNKTIIPSYDRDGNYFYNNLKIIYIINLILLVDSYNQKCNINEQEDYSSFTYIYFGIINNNRDKYGRFPRYSLTDS